MKAFELVQELFGHSADVRCACVLHSGQGTTLVTGSRDRSVRVWQSDAETGEYTQTECNFDDHPHWVNALVSLPTTGFASGCHDHLIRLFDDRAVMLASLGGHTGPVSSLTMLGRDQLGSGSWDGTARVWDLTSKSLVRTLGEQENSVCVLAVGGNRLVCGSAGRAQGNAVVDSTIRVFDPTTFTVETTMKPHDGPIRCLCVVPGSSFAFASASNDGSVVLYSSSDLSVQKRMFNPPGFEGSPAFVYCVEALPGGTQLATACDDCVVRVWDCSSSFDIVQEVEHPSTVWWTCALPSGDLVTTSGDGAVRIFSRTRTGSANNAKFAVLAHEARQAMRNKVSPPMDVSTLVRIEDAPGSGVKDQHVQVFNKSGVAVAYQFTSGRWLEIGQVMGAPPGKEELGGEFFDKVVPVEITDEVNGGEKKLKIGFNLDDNPYVVANAFIKKHGMPDYYLEQIVEFIRQNTNAPAASPAATASPPMKLSFPLTAALSFEKGNATKAVAKLREYQVFSASELADMDGILATLAATSRYHATSFSPAQLSLVCDKALSVIPANDRFPVYDLLRAMLLHPSVAEMISESTCRRVFSDACIAASSPSATPALVLTALRMAANMFRSARTTAFVLLACGDAATCPLEALGPLSLSLHDSNARLATASVLLNAANALCLKKSRGERDLAVLAQCARGATNLIVAGVAEDEATMRAVQALGCVALVEKNLVDKTTVEAVAKKGRKEWEELIFVLL